MRSPKNGAKLQRVIRTCEIILTQVQLPKDFAHGHLVQTSSAATHSVRYRGIVMRGANLTENPKTEGGGNTMIAVSNEIINTFGGPMRSGHRPKHAT